ncbi:MAG: single-stranded DNA-binding protein [Bacilli bacterium]|nr:single-stranded DNA-binding protein [Bacilli bacterium]
MSISFFLNIVKYFNENVCNYLDKGSQVSIEGRIQTGSYTDKDGNRRSSFDVVADNVTFLDSRRQGGSNNSNNEPTPYDYQEEPAPSVNVEDDPFADFGDNVSIDDNFLD